MVQHNSSAVKYFHWPSTQIQSTPARITIMLTLWCLQRKRKEEEERKSKHAEDRERIKLALEDDRLQRQLAQELTAARPHQAAVDTQPDAATPNADSIAQ